MKFSLAKRFQKRRSSNIMVIYIYEPPREKTCICENKDADQRLCFRNTDSTIPLLSKIQNFLSLATFCDSTVRFVSDLFGNHIVGFPTRRLIYCPRAGADQPLGSKFFQKNKSSVLLPISFKFFSSNDILTIFSI